MHGFKLLAVHFMNILILSGRVLSDDRVSTVRIICMVALTFNLFCRYGSLWLVNKYSNRGELKKKATFCFYFQSVIPSVFENQARNGKCLFLPVLLFKKPGEGARYKDLMRRRGTDNFQIWYGDRLQFDAEISAIILSFKCIGNVEPMANFRRIHH